MTLTAIPALMSLAFGGQPGPIDPHDVWGMWLTDDGLTKVEIADCGDGTPCGRVAWVTPDALSPEEKHEVLRDRANPDPALRDRPVIGMPLLYGFRRADDRWRRGRIYDAAEGDTYRASIERLSAAELFVEGCVAVICRDFIWTATVLTPEEEEEAAGYAPSEE